ncbi:MAG: hypothetical protein EBQ80_02750 [Proteobacteria bacterium]|nr:hypothetical protein [Pseudomonadota bacterium]
MNWMLGIFLAVMMLLIGPASAGPAEKANPAPFKIKCACWKQHVGPNCRSDEGLTPATRASWNACVRRNWKK